MIGMRAQGAGSTYTARRADEVRAYLADWILSPCLLMPKLLIFDSSVCRGILSFAAAPEGPETRPWLSAKAASMISTSRSANAERPSRGGADAAVARFSQLSSTENVSVSLRMTARSTTFCNSRMFPGQL